MAKKQADDPSIANSREQLRRMQETGNPLYLWEMLVRIDLRANNWDDPHAKSEVRNWVLADLARVAEAFVKMGKGNALDATPPRWDVPAAGLETITPKQALAEVPRVLGFTKPGRNAFASYRRDQLREVADIKARTGVKPDVLCRYLGVNVKRSLARELAKHRQKAQRRRDS
jgi:hypothetical protein